MLPSRTPRRQHWALGWAAVAAAAAEGSWALFLPWGFVTHVEYVEDSGLFFFVGISFPLLASFVGKILCSLIASWRTGTVLILFGPKEEVPRKGFPETPGPLGRGLGVLLGIAKKSNGSLKPQRLGQRARSPGLGQRQVGRRQSMVI